MPSKSRATAFVELDLAAQLDDIDYLARCVNESAREDWPAQLALVRRIQRVVANAKYNLKRLTG